MINIIDKLDFITIKNFFSTKNNAKATRGKSTGWKKIFEIDASDKDSYPKYTKKS